jgi:hypothetical protein
MTLGLIVVVKAVCCSLWDNNLKFSETILRGNGIKLD